MSDRIALNRINILKNQILKLSSPEITIVGGAAVDVLARTKFMAKKNNSNIGAVEIKFGGVSRNVSECITKLGYGDRLKLITAIGENDNFGHLIQRNFEQLGLRKDGIYHSKTDATAVF